MNRTTLVAGDAGFLLPRLAPAAPQGWDEAVDRAGGSHVILGTGPTAPALLARSIG